MQGGQARGPGYRGDNVLIMGDTLEGQNREVRKVLQRDGVLKREGLEPRGYEVHRRSEWPSWMRILRYQTGADLGYELSECDLHAVCSI